MNDRERMNATHGHHDGVRRVFGDDCDTCVARATGGLEGLSLLDSGNLQKLADLAAEKQVWDNGDLLRPSQIGASYADMKAVETLRLAGRLVYRSGLDPDVAA